MANQSYKKQCFVIQPFTEKFDKRYKDLFKPAIESAGLEAYRVDQDPNVSVPITAIENGIRRASLCLADITEDNLNVCYELGYASALNRPVIMVCSKERVLEYPFDIRSRTVISYKTESTSDFDIFQTNLSTRIKAQLEQCTETGEISKSDPMTPIEGLSPHELQALGVLLAEKDENTGCVSVYTARNKAKKSGLTPEGFAIAVRKLQNKGFVNELKQTHPSEGYDYAGLAISEEGWNWITFNEFQFALHTADDIPF